jgi:hypothetical protein
VKQDICLFYRYTFFIFGADHLIRLTAHSRRLSFEEVESIGILTYIENEKGDFDVPKFMHEESLSPFPERSPLAHLTLIANYKDNLEDETTKNYSCLIISFHHTLVDGFSIMKLAHQICKLRYKPSAKPNQELDRPSGLSALLRVPYDICDYLTDRGRVRTYPVWDMDKSSADKHELAEKETAELLPAGYFTSVSDFIYLSDLRTIAAKHGVRTFTVILAAITGTIREVMFPNGNMPKKIDFAVPFPLPGHPDKLRNHL